MLKVITGGRSYGPRINRSSFGMHFCKGGILDYYGVEIPPIGYSKNFPFRDIGQGRHRLHDSRTAAMYNNPEDGVFHWSQTDWFDTNINQALGQQCIFPVGRNAAAWAATGAPTTTAKNPYRYVNIEKFREYVTAVMTRYGNRFVYENVNEPNLADFVTGPSGPNGEIDTVVDEHRITSEVRDLVAPTALICSSSPTGQTGVGQWHDAFARRGGLEYVDVLGVHFYVQPAQPEALIPQLGYCRALLRKYGKPDMPIWLTETGWQQFRLNGALINTGGVAATLMPSAMACAYLHRAHLCAFAGGAEVICWYGLNHDWSSLRFYSTDTNSGWPAYDAAASYTAITDLLVGARVGNIRISGGLHTLPLRLADGRTGVVYWCADNIEMSLDLSAFSEVVDVMGLSHSPSASFTVSNSPVYALYN